MATDGSRDRVLDASVLINFLRVDQQGLLGSHSSTRYLVTDHVDREVSAHFADQRARFESAVANGHIQLISVTDMHELELFARLSADRRLGIGECAAFAVAIYRRVPIATDDRAARKVVARLHPETTLLDSAGLVREFIAAGMLTVEDADAIKRLWENEHRFRLPFDSFRDP